MGKRISKRGRGGRPKLNRPRIDLGTPEAQLKRIIAIGGKPVAIKDKITGAMMGYTDANDKEDQQNLADGKPSNARFARGAAPIDALLARGMISEEAHEAANYYAALRKMRFGKATTGAVDLNAAGGGVDEYEHEKAAEREKRYNAAVEAMCRVSRKAFDAVENVVVHERWRDWMFGGRGMNRNAERRAFGEGIAALLSWKIGSKRTQEKKVA